MSGGGGDAVPASPARRRSRDVAVLAALVVIVAAAYAPMLATGERLADNDDFLIGAARHEFLRQSLFTYGAFPLRCQYFGSGYSTLADPEDPALNPLAWCLLPFSSVFALKARFFLAGIVAAVGTYLLARGPLAYTRWGAAFAALAFSLGLWLPGQIVSGNTNEMYAGFVPLCLFLVLTSPRRPIRFAFLCPLLYTMLSDGKFTFLAALWFMGMTCAAWAVLGWAGARGRSLRGRLQPLTWLALAAACAFLIGMARLGPMLQTGFVRRALLEPEWAVWDARAMWKAEPVFPTVRDLAEQAFGLRRVDPADTPLYVGLVPVLLFAAGAVVAWRKAGSWAIIAVLMVWLTVGPNAPVNLYGVVNRLPLYNAIDAPEKYFRPFIALSVCLGSGAFFGPLMSMRSRRLGHVLAAGATAGAVLALVPTVMRASAKPFRLRPPGRVAGPPEDFYSVAGKGLPRNRAGPIRANPYLNLLRHVGTLDFYTPVPQAERGRPRYFVNRRGAVALNPDYRGEAYFREPNNRCLARFEPTRIRLYVLLTTPEALIINQNFDPGWRADRGVLIEREGLLALSLERPGQYLVTLRYSSRAFECGLVMSLCGVGLLAGFVVLRHRRRLRWLGPAEAEPLQAGTAAREWRIPAEVMTALVVGAIALASAGAWIAARTPPAPGDQGAQEARPDRIDEHDPAYGRPQWAPPGSAEHHYNLALRLEAEGNLVEAIAQYRDMARLRPDDADAQDILGAALARMRAHDDAVRRRRRATDRDRTEAPRAVPQPSPPHYRRSAAGQGRRP